MTHANPKFQMGKPLLTVDTLKEVGKSYVILHDYYINNYKKHQHIIGGFKENHFLVGEGIFRISWYDLEGSEKATRGGGVNGSQSKFSSRT
jgi:hypothetical protein